MRSESEILDLQKRSYKEIEQELGIKIRNGQAMEGVRKALQWVVGTSEQCDRCLQVTTCRVVMCYDPRTRLTTGKRVCERCVDVMTEKYFSPVCTGSW